MGARASCYNSISVASSETKRIICLANSRKPYGRCIAGKEFNGTRSWIRPVSDRDDGEVSLEERQYEDGSDPRVLDVIDIPLLKARPVGCQQENWLLDPEYYWTRVGRFPESDLDRLLDPVERLWIDGASTSNGQNDKILRSQERALRSSLRFVRVDGLELSVFAPGAGYGNRKRRVQGQFQYAGESYKLWVTDPAVERPYLKKGDGEYDFGPCFMTISIGEPYKRARYKLIAAIIPATGS